MEYVTRAEVTLLASTHIHAEAVEILAPDWVAPYSGDIGADSQVLAEFAGRECYQSWTNPAGRTNEQYLANIIEHGHLSVLEHGNFTFEFRGISRSLTHEFVRHRHFSYSQESQRYVPASAMRYVIPPDIQGDEALEAVFKGACQDAQNGYDCLLSILEEKYAGIEDRVERRKKARQAARSVLPNAAETKIVVTGNIRAWRWFLHMRGSVHADVEIRRVACEVLRQLQEKVPACFQDFLFKEAEDGEPYLDHPYPY